jgi:hypothetical protein
MTQAVIQYELIYEVSHQLGGRVAGTLLYILAVRVHVKAQGLISGLRFFLAFLSPSRQMERRYYIRLSHDRFRLYPF